MKGDYKQNNSLMYSSVNSLHSPTNAGNSDGVRSIDIKSGHIRKQGYQFGIKEEPEEESRFKNYHRKMKSQNTNYPTSQGISFLNVSSQQK